MGGNAFGPTPGRPSTIGPRKASGWWDRIYSGSQDSKAPSSHVAWAGQGVQDVGRGANGIMGSDLTSQTIVLAASGLSSSSSARLDTQAYALSSLFCRFRIRSLVCSVGSQ